MNEEGLSKSNPASAFRARGSVLLALLGKLLLATAGLALATPVLVLFVAGRCDC